MKLEKNKVLKGFTLVELIVVIAIFGMLMAATLSLLQPTLDIERRATEYSMASGVIDNARMAVEDKLRYANRMSVYVGPDISCAPDADDALKTLKERDYADTIVSTFRKKFLLDAMTTAKPDGRQRISFAKDEVYVMRINNPEPTELKNGIKADHQRPGKISVWKYVNGGRDDANSKDSVFSDGLYGDYSFSLWFGAGIKKYTTKNERYLGMPKKLITDGEYDQSNTAVPASDFSMVLDIYENNYAKKEAADKKASDYTLYKTDITSKVALSFMNMSGGDSLESETIKYKDTKDENKIKTVNKDDTVRYEYNYYTDTTKSYDIYIVYTLPDF